MGVKEFWKKMKWWKKIALLIALIVVVFVLTVLIIFPISCSDTDTYLGNEIEKANYCNTKEDCIEIYNPRGCTTYINKNKVNKIRLLDTLYFFKVIMFKCPITLLECMPCFDAECKNSKCQSVCLQDICDKEVKFIVKSVCKFESDYKIFISNDANVDIVGWKIRLYQTVEKEDGINSDEGIQAFGTRQITVTPQTVTEVRKVEAFPLIRVADTDFICAQNIDSYGDFSGSPITEECT